MAEEWYFCLDHRTVEPKEGCPSSERLGPYPTRAQDARALEISEARNRLWDRDPRWKDEEG